MATDCPEVDGPPAFFTAGEHVLTKTRVARMIAAHEALLGE